MRDPRIDQVARAVEQKFPGTSVAVRPSPSPDDPDVEWMLYVTGVPAADEDDLGWFTLDLGIELFGESSIPFMALAVTPEWLAQNDADEGGSAHAGR